MPVIKVLISDAEESHGNTCESKILEECPTATTEVRIESLASSVVYALANGFHIISRSTTGLSDSRNENEGDTAYDGAELTDGGFSSGFSFGFDSAGTWRVGIVHAHGSNSHVLDTDPSQLDVICAVGAGDGAGNNNCSYGPGLELFNDDETCESYATARIAGIIAQLMTDHPTWTFQDCRMVLRQTASFYATGWIADGGFGSSDKVNADLVETIAMFSPTRKEYTNEDGEISFAWKTNPQTDFENSIIALFSTEPDRDTTPSAAEIIYAGILEALEYSFGFNGTYYFAYYSRNEGLDYSLLESFDIEEVVLQYTPSNMSCSLTNKSNNCSITDKNNNCTITSRAVSGSI